MGWTQMNLWPFTIHHASQGNTNCEPGLIDGVHFRTYIFNSYSNGGQQQKMVRVVICPCHLFINDYTECWEYDMPHGTSDEEKSRGFSETLSEGALWQTGGPGTKWNYTAMVSEVIGMNQCQNHATGMGMVWAGNTGSFWTVDCSQYYDGEVGQTLNVSQPACIANLFADLNFLCFCVDLVCLLACLWLELQIVTIS